MPSQCVICGVSIPQTRVNRVTCRSKPCVRARQRELERRTYRLRNKVPSPEELFTCPVCGTVVQKKRHDRSSCGKITCVKAISNKARDERRKAKTYV